jgi:triacylglycerol lipase
VRRPTPLAAAATMAAAVVCVPAAVAAPTSVDPAFSVAPEVLDASLECPEAYVHADREPVLLVHGTGTRGPEQFDWNWRQVLPGLGFDVCVVTYPDRGLGDQQVAAEYVAHAVMTMHAATGRRVDLAGHSQGGSMSRWAVRFWPSVREAIDDYVAIAAPHHGIEAVPAGLPRQDRRQPESFFQFDPSSRFVTILDRGDETPGDVDWTNLYTRTDELVQPVAPVPTAALDWQRDNPRVANVLLQDLCPGRAVDHMSIGTTDRLAFDLAVDAFVHDGPADPGRLALGPACSVADQIVEGPGPGAGVVDLLLDGLATGLPDLHLADEEPPTRDYAIAPGPQEPSPSPTSPASSTTSIPVPTPTASPTATTPSPAPATPGDAATTPTPAAPTATAGASPTDGVAAAGTGGRSSTAARGGVVVAGLVVVGLGTAWLRRRRHR